MEESRDCKDMFFGFCSHMRLESSEVMKIQELSMQSSCVRGK